MKTKKAENLEKIITSEWHEVLNKLREYDSYHCLHESINEPPTLENWQWAWEFCRRGEKYQVLDNEISQYTKNGVEWFEIPATEIGTSEYDTIRKNKNGKFEKFGKTSNISISIDVGDKLKGFGLEKYVHHKTSSEKIGADIWQSNFIYRGASVPVTGKVLPKPSQEEQDAIDHLASVQWGNDIRVSKEFSNFDTWLSFCRSTYRYTPADRRDFQTLIDDQGYCDVRLYKNYDEKKQLEKCKETLDRLNAPACIVKGAPVEIARFHKMVIVHDIKKLEFQVTDRDIYRFLNPERPDSDQTQHSDAIKALLKTRRKRKNGKDYLEKGIDYYIDGKGHFDFFNI